MHRLKFFLALALLVLVGSDLISVEAFIIPGFRINLKTLKNFYIVRVLCKKTFPPFIVMDI